MKNFKEYIREAAKKNNSRLIFNLDLSAEIDFLNYKGEDVQKSEIFDMPKLQSNFEQEKVGILKEKASGLLNEISNYIAAVKINRPFTDVVGLDFIPKLKKFDLPLIADFKLADIDNTNKLIARNAFNAGFDAIIAHAFLGEDAVKAVVDVAEERQKGVILVVNMSHPGSKEFITPCSSEMAKIAKKLNADGVIAPATRPEEIVKIRNIVGEILIFAPGVGIQGGKVGDAIKHGADFEMVGRSIYNAKDPKKVAAKIWKELKYF